VQPPHLAEEREVLHVARADLEHVRVAGHELDLAGVHHFGDDGQPGLGPHVGQDPQALLTEPAERVGRRARLEGAATQAVGAGPSDGPGGACEHVASLDRAGARDDEELVSTDRRVAQRDGRRSRGEFAGGELVRLGHLMDGLHAGKRQQGHVGEALLVSDAAHDGAGFSAGHVGTEAERLDPFADVIELLVGDARASDDDHGSGSSGGRS